MQIFPANWSNPAAATQQALQHPRGSTAPHSPPSSPAISDVGKAEKTGDRDADERYDGPMAGYPKPPSSGEQEAESPSPQLELSLPADSGEESKFDVLG
ncbi:hypothetical protein SH467x_003910 [Pirellulaceae bacterium SH467]